MKTREAKQNDLKDIQIIEKEYYEGYFCPRAILESWIKKGKTDFLIAEDTNEKPLAFLFLEAVRKIKPLPFIHKPKDEAGKYLYVSEVGILDKYAKTNLLDDLFKEMVKKNKDKKGIIWVTGGKSKHDKTELRILKKEGFKKLKRIKKWEAYPKCFVDDHWVWFKALLTRF